MSEPPQGTRPGGRDRGPLHGPLAETPDDYIYDYGDHPDHPDNRAEARDRYVLISDEYSWDAVIAPDGGEVPREVAEAMLADVGHTFGPDFEPEEQRFRETEVTPDSPWDRKFTQDNAGPIHGWKVEG